MVRASDSLLSAVLLDFAGTPVEQARVALVHLDPADLDRSGLDDAASWLDPDDPRGSSVLLRIDDNTLSTAEPKPTMSPSP